MNDPNGLSYVDGVWHAYYQHFPDDDVWGPMHWRHATSPDLLHWTDHGIALHPTELGAIFSGSVVVDTAGSAGFGRGARVAIFTLADGHTQRQGIAWSRDGYRWEMHDANPILVDDHEPDFRDPKVFRFDNRWIMVLAVGDRVRLYRSHDLRSWTLTSETVLPDLVGTVECPDLIAVPGSDGPTSWVLIYGDDRAGPGRHGATIGVIGSFDGERFEPRGSARRLDAGPDWYAAQSFHGVSASAGPVLMGWMNSWRYANTHPSSGRRGVLSLPRRLAADAASDRLFLRPAVDLDTTFPVAIERPSITIDGGQVARVGGESLSLRVLSAEGEVVRIDLTDGRAAISRRSSGMPKLDFDETVEIGAGPSELVLDHGTLELFAANGSVFSLLFFAGPSWTVETTGAATLTLSHHD